jgi:hypothetical protein
MYQSEWQEILHRYVPSAEKVHDSVRLTVRGRDITFIEPLSPVVLHACYWFGYRDVVTPWNGSSDLEGIEDYAQWARASLIPDTAKTRAFDFLKKNLLSAEDAPPAFSWHSAFCLCQCLFAYVNGASPRLTVWRDINQLLANTCSKTLGIDENARRSHIVVAGAFIDTHILTIANTLTTRTSNADRRR